MYGLVNKAIEELVTAGFGEAKWEELKAGAGVDTEVFISNEGYPDEVTYRLVASAVRVLGMPVEDILIAFGEHWVLKTAAQSYGPLLKSGGRTLPEFLVNLPNFHTRVALIFPNLKPPTFTCTDVTADGLHLHYFTHRPGLTSFVIGLVRGLGKLYETPVDARVVQSRADGSDHDVFAVRWGTAP